MLLTFSHFLWCPAALGAAHFPILVCEVEQEQRLSLIGDRQAIVVGAGLCDGQGERAYTTYAPYYDIIMISYYELSAKDLFVLDICAPREFQLGKTRNEVSRT